MILRMVLIAVGTLCLILGITGIFVPGLPTTPFLLLTAGLYVRSSDRLYQKLTGNRYVGAYLTHWQATRGLSRQVKVSSILVMWTMISLSLIFFIQGNFIRILIGLAGLIGTLVMGFVIPTIKKKP